LRMGLSRDQPLSCGMSPAMIDAMSSELFEEIAEAFPPTILEDALFASPGGLWDVYANFGFDAAYGKTWSSLDPRFVEKHGSALAFMAPEGFVATIPAYLVALIRGTQNEMPVLVLGQLWARPGFKQEFEVRLAHLTANQRSVIARVMCALAESDRFREIYPEEIEPVVATWRPMLE
jgi:hypothetical protein